MNIYHQVQKISNLLNHSCSKSSLFKKMHPGPNGVVYYGRGYIQLTWEGNYRPASQYLYNDESVLLNNPEIVADHQVNACHTQPYLPDPRYIDFFVLVCRLGRCLLVLGYLRSRCSRSSRWIIWRINKCHKRTY